jgi:hypothetical protein
MHKDMALQKVAPGIVVSSRLTSPKCSVNVGYYFLDRLPATIKTVQCTASPIFLPAQSHLLPVDMLLPTAVSPRPDESGFKIPALQSSHGLRAPPIS